VAPIAELFSNRWKKFPTVTTVNHVREIKPGAVVLITGSMPVGGRAGDPGQSLRSYEQPVLVYQRYGRGMSVAFTVQDSWNWQMDPATPVEDQAYSQLWRQMLRWLTSDVPNESSCRCRRIRSIRSPK
jgi:hypothetical protein